MQSTLLSTGFGNYVARDHVLAISGTTKNGTMSVHLKHQVEQARADGTLIKHTNGRATHSVLHLKGGVLVASALTSLTLRNRWLNANDTGGDEDAS